MGGEIFVIFIIRNQQFRVLYYLLSSCINYYFSIENNQQVRGFLVRKSWVSLHDATGPVVGWDAD